MVQYVWSTVMMSFVALAFLATVSLVVRNQLIFPNIKNWVSQLKFCKIISMLLHMELKFLPWVLSYGIKMEIWTN
jgi:hypothetical protein